MSSEACTVPGYKERLLEATSRDTIITAAYTGKPCRVLKNEYAKAQSPGTASACRPAPARVPLTEP